MQFRENAQKPAKTIRLSPEIIPGKGFEFRYYGLEVNAVKMSLTGAELEELDDKCRV